VTLAEELEDIVQCKAELIYLRAITPAMRKAIEMELVAA